jgi:hypothetical protein
MPFSFFPICHSADFPKLVSSCNPLLYPPPPPPPPLSVVAVTPTPSSVVPSPSLPPPPLLGFNDKTSLRFLNYFLLVISSQAFPDSSSCIRLSRTHRSLSLSSVFMSFSVSFFVLLAGFLFFYTFVSIASNPMVIKSFFVVKNECYILDRSVMEVLLMGGYITYNEVHFVIYTPGVCLVWVGRPTV